MLVTELGMVTLVRLLQALNASFPMLVTELGMVTLVRLLQPENEYHPMLVTELGIIVVLQPAISVLVDFSMIALQLSRESYFGLLTSTVTKLKPLQRENAEFPMLVTELGMVTLVRPLQPWNAYSPMLVTELGMVTLVRLLQS